MDIFINAISNVGFPIVMCIMIYQNQTSQIKEITKVVSNNTNVISKIAKKLGIEEDK